MCGRYSLFAPPGEIEERFDAAFDYDFEPRYNAAPRQALPVITNEDPEAIQRMEWGLVPSWADDRSDFGFINARAETVDEKASFSDAYERRRCLVPADGFYEWTETDGVLSSSARQGPEDERSESSGGKQPYRVERADGSLFAMAGLYERWEPPQRQTGLGEFGGDDAAGAEGADDDVVETFTIVTTEPSDDVASLHHRMAVVLEPGEEETWLHGDPAARRDLLRPYPGDLSVRPVSRVVNDPGNDSPSVLAPPG